MALVLMLLLRSLMESSIFLFVAAVAISAMYGGLGPCLVATLLLALEVSFFLLPPYNTLLTVGGDHCK